MMGLGSTERVKRMGDLAGAAAAAAAATKGAPDATPALWAAVGVLQATPEAQCASCRR